MISFDAPPVLYAAPVIALVILGLAFWARSARVRRAGAWSDDLGAVARETGRGGVVALGVTALLVSAALAGPRFGRRVVTTETKALTMVLAVDISRSMLAEDVVPSRLGRAQREARRLIQDLRGDRIGLIAFAGRSFILSPLTVDDGALLLMVDGLAPDLASAGGTEMAVAIEQGRQLLMAGPGVADRVLVIFSDGEAHDSVANIVAAAERLRRDGIHLIVVAEGGSAPVGIPLRDPNGVLTGYQEDLGGNVVQTRRRDDVLFAVVDAARGTLVPAGLGDQSGAVRDVVDALKRVPQATTTAVQDISRAWIFLLAAVAILLLQTYTRRTAALAAIAFMLMVPKTVVAQTTLNVADRAWRDSLFSVAADLYEQQVRSQQGGDTAWLNLGTAALVIGDTARAHPALARAAESLDPELRFRALFNLGLASLRLAEADEANRQAYLEEARRHYREALLLRPGDDDTKWNYELAAQPAPPQDGGGQQPPPNPGEQDDPARPRQTGLTREQAEAILNSMLAEERDTLDKINKRRAEPRNAVRRKNW
ncbi:MAG: VWA domain-containing protein [Gemmatimonadales bacterium]